MKKKYKYGRIKATTMVVSMLVEKTDTDYGIVAEIFGILSSTAPSPDTTPSPKSQPITTSKGGGGEEMRGLTNPGEKLSRTHTAKARPSQPERCKHEHIIEGKTYDDCLDCGKQLVEPSQPKIEKIEPIYDKPRFSCYNSKKEIVEKINQIIDYINSK